MFNFIRDFWEDHLREIEAEFSVHPFDWGFNYVNMTSEHPKLVGVMVGPFSFSIYF